VEGHYLGGQTSKSQTVIIDAMKCLFVILFLLVGSLTTAQAADTVYSDSNVTSSGTMDTTVRSPPPSAISPQISSGTGDLCTIGVSGAVQTQILGISVGKVFTEENCLRLKNAKTMYDMGMKVAAVSVMCQDSNVKLAMKNAGTPCPINGLIGDAATMAWEEQELIKPETYADDGEGAIKGMIKNVDKDTKFGVGAVLGALGLLLLL